MKIKRSRRREWARLLVKVAVFAVLIVAVKMLLKIQRIEGGNRAPLYKDGDLVLMWRVDDTPFLQLRIRGFDD